MTATDLQAHPTMKGAAYRYIRQADRLPSTEEALAMGPDAPVKVKLFNPTGAGTWYITGYDPDTGVATGAAHVHYLDQGDFYMPELVALKLRFGLALERDLHWTPMTLREVVEAGRP